MSYIVLTDSQAQNIADMLRFFRPGRIEVTDDRATLIVERERSNSAPVITLYEYDKETR